MNSNRTAYRLQSRKRCGLILKLSQLGNYSGFVFPPVPAAVVCIRLLQFLQSKNTARRGESQSRINNFGRISFKKRRRKKGKCEIS